MKTETKITEPPREPDVPQTTTLLGIHAKMDKFRQSWELASVSDSGQPEIRPAAPPAKDSKLSSQTMIILRGTLLIGVIVILCGLSVWNTETFQRNIFPKKYWTHYWTEECTRLRVSIQENELWIALTEIELKKSQRTNDLDILQIEIYAKATGKASRMEVVKKEAEDNYSSLVEELNVRKQQLKEYAKELEKANQELSRYENMK